MPIKRFVSFRKGEVLLHGATGQMEDVKVILHANTLTPLADRLHFDLKPGHLMVYIKRKDKQGNWTLEDRGYVNTVNSSLDTSRLYNTLKAQQLWSKGWLRTKQIDEYTWELNTYSLWPLHRRRVIVRLLDCGCTLEITDWYVGCKKVAWNWSSVGYEETEAWWRQTTNLFL